MQFEWDENKNRINKAKHGISFELASEVWLDPNHVILDDVTSPSEGRWIAIGLVDARIVLLGVHNYRRFDDEIVRIIGARRATPHERRRYQEGNFA